MSLRFPGPPRRVGGAVASGLAALLVATALGLALEGAGLRDPSPLYLVAVALVALLHGSPAAVAAAVGAFLAYNFLFVHPRFTLLVADLQGLLTLAVLLLAGVAIGRLTGEQRDRAHQADRREREARSLYAVSRAISSARRTQDALAEVVAVLVPQARVGRAWVGLGSTTAHEAVAADSGNGDVPVPLAHSILRRHEDGTDLSWVRLSPPRSEAVKGAEAGVAFYRVVLSGGDRPVGSLWASRLSDAGPPDGAATRLLAAVADQIGQGVLRDRLADQASEAEIVRRGEELKAALLDSVSHDLRTPLASIRAAAGTLADEEVHLAEADRNALARQIDAEAQRLARLVDGLLDMNRIEGGGLKPQAETIPVAEMVLPAIERARGILGGRRVEVNIPVDIADVTVDLVLADQVISNLLENVARHTPDGVAVRVAADRQGDEVRIRVEDGGAGVPVDVLPHLFEKFYRGPATGGASRPGSGLGLAVVQGMTQAMGGSVSASSSPLGGLAIDVCLPMSETDR